MNRSLLVSALLLAFGASMAQHNRLTDKANEVIDQWMSEGQSDVAEQLSAQAGKESLLDSLKIFYLDPTAWPFKQDRKERRYYDDQDRLVKSVYYLYSISNGWEVTHKSEKSYPNDQTTVETRLDWNGKEFIPNIKRVNTLNEAGNNLLEQRFVWNDNKWENSLEVRYAYKKMELMTDKESRRWQNEAWLNVRKDKWTYDNQGRRTSYVQQKWDSTHWENDYANITDHNQVPGPVTLIFDWDGKQWKRTFKYISFNDSVNKTSGYESFQWDSTAWVPYTRQTFFYDTKDQLIRNLEEVGDGMNWVNHWQYLFVFDSLGRQTDWTWQPWESGSFVDNLRGHLDFNSDDQAVFNSYELFNGLSWATGMKYRYTYTASKLLQSIARDEKESGAWKRIDSTHYYYRGVIQGLDPESAEVPFSFYPNPVIDGAFINLPSDRDLPVQISLVDMKGGLVKEETMSSKSHYLNCRDLAPGTYVLSLTSRSGRRSAELLVVE